MEQVVCMLCGPTEKGFERVPREVLELAVRKKGMPEVLVRSVKSLYERAKHESE